jgi:uncharacterized paraquat-inducible protein A
MFNSQLCGILGILSTVAHFLIPLSHIPSVIETRCTMQLDGTRLFMSLLNAIQWALWSFLTRDYYYMTGQMVATCLIIVPLLFFCWANRIIIKPPSEKTTIIQGALNRLMSILITYFKQYTVSKNLQEMQVRFYTSNKR